MAVRWLAHDVAAVGIAAAVGAMARAGVGISGTAADANRARVKSRLFILDRWGCSGGIASRPLRF